jgi:ABC-2 type transport system permease protein
MMANLGHIAAVGGRVLAQLRSDRRLVALSLVFPLVVIYFMKVLVDALASPSFVVTVYIVPYGAFIVHFITYMLTGIVLVRERTAGTLARMFVSGYREIEIIFGYLLAYTLLATLQSLLILAELSYLFELGYSFWRLASIYLVMWLLAIISMALGILASNLSRNEGQVVAFFPLILISFILSGVIIPFDRLPVWSQVLSYATPLFYANEVLQDLITGGGLFDSPAILAGLPIYGLLVVGLAAVSLREVD